MSDMTSEEYKRGFITGLAMNPLMVTTETATTEPNPKSDSGVIIMNGVTGFSGVRIINNIVLCTKGVT